MKTQRARSAHRMVCSAIVLILLAAAAYATAFGTVLVTLGAGLSVALMMLALRRMRSPERWRATALAALGMVAVGVLIQAAQGRTETHFAIFVFLALLPNYRDWLPIVAAALTVCLHHVLFNLLQQWSWGPVCFVEPSLGKVIEHALYVGLAAGGLLALSQRERVQMSGLRALNAMMRRALARIRATTEVLAQSTRSISPTPPAATAETAVAGPLETVARRLEAFIGNAEGRRVTSQLAQATAHLDEVAAERELTVAPLHPGHACRARRGDRCKPCEERLSRQHEP